MGVCVCVLNELERRMPTFAQMSTHRSGIQGTEGAWKVEHHHMWVIFLPEDWALPVP